MKTHCMKLKNSDCSHMMLFVRPKLQIKGFLENDLVSLIVVARVVSIQLI